MLVVVKAGVSWRAAFWMFGGLGLCWLHLFALWFRNRPEEKSGVNQAELNLIRAGVGHEADKADPAVPWGQLLRSKTLWAVLPDVFLYVLWMVF